MRKTNSGTSVCEFGIAVNERVKSQDGSYADKPVFVDLTAWSQTADFICQYLQKGSQVLVEGRLQLDQWQDRDSGQNRSKLKVVADRVQSLSTKKDQPQQQAPQSNNYQQPQAPLPEAPPFPTMPKQAPTGFSGPGEDSIPGLDSDDESLGDIPFNHAV
jgi:single-strand DNA-binding protein